MANPSRPPLGAAPGDLPTIERTKLPLHTLVWGMLPMGVGAYGRCTKPNGHCAADGAPRSMHPSEFSVCFAWIRDEWHEVVKSADLRPT